MRVQRSQANCLEFVVRGSWFVVGGEGMTAKGLVDAGGDAAGDVTGGDGPEGVGELEGAGAGVEGFGSVKKRGGLAAARGGNVVGLEEAIDAGVEKAEGFDAEFGG